MQISWQSRIVHDRLTYNKHKKPCAHVYVYSNTGVQQGYHYSNFFLKIIYYLKVHLVYESGARPMNLFFFSSKLD